MGGRVWWRVATRQMLDVVFPPTCVGCGARAHWLCAACQQRIERLPLPQCGSCGAVWATAEERHRCTPRAPVTVVCAAGVYAGPLRQAVIALKYQGRHGVAATLVTLLEPTMRPLVREDDLLIPVPLHPARLRERGYNQAAILAAELAERLSCDVAPDSLRRIRPTAQQTRMASAAERRSNVQGAFQTVDAAVAGRRVWLVDDVCTTGATLHAAAAALRDAGARDINGAVVARAYGQA